MCLPLLAVAAIATTASAVVGTVGAIKNSQNQKKQLGIQAATDAANAELARKNVALAQSNAKAATDAAETNSANLLRLTEINATTRQGMTDLNVSLAESISNFNDQVADGQAQILIGKGEMEASYAELNAKTAEFNAANAEDTAQAATVASGRDEQASRLNYARLKSTQRATLSANGVVLGEGSALRIQTDTDYFSDVDADTIHANGVRAAMGYRAQETNFLTDARTARIGGQVARINAATEAAAVKAQAFGAKMSADRDILNMKMSTSFEILQARSNAAIESDNILNQGRIEATNYEMQAAGFESQATGFAGAAAGASAARSGISPFLNGAGAFLDGASSAASKWYSYGKTA